MEEKNCSLCGENCNECGFREKCAGCVKTCGNPFGDGCLAASYIKMGGKEEYQAFKQELISEFNALGIEGLPEIRDLVPLAGFYVNLAYPLPSGEKTKLLRDDHIYLGTQVASVFDDPEAPCRAFGLIADAGFLLVAEYGENGEGAEIVAYRRR